MGHSSELRPYQLEALQEIAEAFLERRVNKQLLVLPTGTGKTVVFAHLLRHPSIAAWLSQFPPRERRGLIVAHREELLEQAQSTLARINPELRVSIEQGARNAAADCDVVVASIQTIGRRGTERLRRLEAERFRIVIVDEAHHAPARTYLNMLEHFAPDVSQDGASTDRLI